MSPERRLSRRRVLAIVAALVVAIAVAGLALTRVRSDPALGQVVPDALAGEVDGDEASVLVPGGRVRVTVGEPVRAIPQRRIDGDEDLQAESGEAFLPIDIEVEDEPMLGMTAIDVADAPRASLSLRVGGAAYGLPGDDVVRGGFYLRIPDDAGDAWELAVDYDGVTQTVDSAGQRDSGPAAPLYDLPAAPTFHPCDDGWRARPASELLISCDVAAHAVPYLPGLGWAEDEEPGAAWVVVVAHTWLSDAEVAPRRRGFAGDCDLATPASGHIELDGERASAALTEQERSFGPNKQILKGMDAFLVPADRPAVSTVRLIQRHPCAQTGGRFAIALAMSLDVRID